MSENINTNNKNFDNCHNDIENQHYFIGNICNENFTESDFTESYFTEYSNNINPNQINKFKKSLSYPNGYKTDYTINQNEKYDYSGEIQLCKINNFSIPVQIKSTQFNSNEQFASTCASTSTNTCANDCYSDSDSNDNLSNNLIINKTKIEIIYGKLYKIVNLFKINKINKVEIINKFISICLHVFIMIIFEIFFYFNYIVNIEKQSFLKELSNYLGQMKNIPLTSNQIKMIKLILNSNSNSNNLLNMLYEQYIQSLELQKKILHDLLIKSCKMAGIVGIVLIILFLSGLANRKKIKWNWIFIENILMFVFLGIFEYFFFTNIIMGYSPITDAEIKYFVADKVFNYFNSTT